ncbi:uncharacterized protein LOC132174632 [Corylus avellana]|uniref:uncharacterized protein LOC132174632 n=1 Tax=Corylus avellana TaxID=13451 RepID=UPI00286C4A3A|nr:uncharacterized protein LOC132174632 [Corylus avellana]
MEENQESQIYGWEECSRPRVMGPTTMGNGSLCIKLKIPKAEFVAAAEEEEEAPSAATPIAIAKDCFPRICNICDKGFASGKALGGHMRMHVQARNKELLQNNQNPLAAADHRLSPAPPKPINAILGEPTCCVCGKNFPTMKALFGHMRSHPGRPWRGILPPPTADKNNESSSSSTLSDDHHQHKIDSAAAAVVLPTSLLGLGWKVTGKRGRRSNASSTSGSGSGSGSDSGSGSGLSRSMEEEIEEVVCEVLLTLSNGNPKKRLSNDDCDEPIRNSPSKKKKQQQQLRIVEAEADHTESIREDLSKKKGKAVLESSDHNPLNTKWKLWEDDEDYHESNIDSNAEIFEELDHRLIKSNNSELVSDNEILGKKMKMMRKKKRKIKFVELEALKDGGDHQKQIAVIPNTNTNTNNNYRYTCCLCNKSFPTHQALGGHKSSHNKMKNIQSSSVSAEDDSAAEDCGGHSANPTTQVDEAAATHQCKICDKTFPTGQALGGHKRCHWTGPHQVTSPEEEEDHQQVAAATATQTGQRVVMDFDLNELPAVEVEEGIVDDP